MSLQNRLQRLIHVLGANRRSALNTTPDQSAYCLITLQALNELGFVDSL